MSETRKTNTKGKQVAVVIGATSKWQAEGRNTLLAHGHPVDDSELPVGVRWGVGGAVAQKFAQEGFFIVLTTRNEANAAPLGGGDPRAGRRLHDRRTRSRLAGFDRVGIRHDPPRGRRPRGAGLQRRLSRRPRSAARQGTARIRAGRDPRYGLHIACPRAVSRRQGGVAGDAQERPGLVLLLQQLELAARQEADDRPVAILSAGA